MLTFCLSRAWYPEGLEMKRGKTAAAPKTHRLADKTIADVCEALIGAALLTFYGTNNLDNAVRAVTELVCSTDHTMTSYKEYYLAYEKPRYQTALPTASQRNLAMQVQKKHAYAFKYPRVLRSAFVHPSYPFCYEHVPNFQRLEFLGDSLLDMACINFLFHRFPNRDPQWLTEHKMAMVSNQFLGALCVSLGFYKHLLQFNSQLQKQIANYVTEITEALEEAEDDAVKAGKTREDRSPDYWVHTKQPPKCLPDMIEAYVGAIFVDSEYNYGEVERFFQMHIQPYFENMELYDTYANKHPVTFLTNFLEHHMGCSNWNVYAQQLPDIGDGLPPQIVATVMVHNQIIMSQQGTSGKYAKISVAKKALEMLKGLPLPEFRVTYQCDCKTTQTVDGDEEDEEKQEERIQLKNESGNQ
jgi:endoribonuclease Dicer